MEVVYREGKLKLLHYLPQTGQRRPIPLVIVYALVNRPYILDLLPGRSVVEHFVKGSVEVYLIDWGVPDQADYWNTLGDYIAGYIRRCVGRVKALTGASQVSLLGYCQGGTFAAIYTALYLEQVKNVILMATPIDFGVSGGLLNLWSRKEHFDAEKLVDTFGNIPPWILNSAFVMLKPIHYGFDKYVRFWWSLLENTADDASVEEFVAIEKWLADGIPHPGEAFREFVEACVQDNRLIRNELKIDSRIADLRQITCSVCNLIAEKDHIIPPQSSRAFN
jgi:polyhydroxyalkanoate synthase